ncbi:hypothetical protein Pmani_007009 [Petrolisthes manimaculis]|uniref:Uncharacterized protein n=1 Tax=Petrolisthes manimaculis TaxID=1843537 RepID=A0AAE1Q9G9_9EUCA|nr:hypothetical protein Pmani_007009 [Petrolisthes manimaculis]
MSRPRSGSRRLSPLHPHTHLQPHTIYHRYRPNQPSHPQYSLIIDHHSYPPHKPTTHSRRNPLFLLPPQHSLHRHRHPYPALARHQTSLRHPPQNHNHPILLPPYIIPRPVPLPRLHRTPIPFSRLLFHPYLSLFHPLLRPISPPASMSRLPLLPTPPSPIPNPSRHH